MKLCLFIGLSVVFPLSAQDDVVPGQQEPGGRVAWFVHTSMPEGLENPVSVMSGKEVTEMVLSKRSPSGPIKIPADGILRIVRKVPDETKPGEFTYLTLAQADVPDGVGKALVILMPVEKNSKGLLFRTKVQDLAGFKGGDSLYLNLTSLRVGIDLGKASMEVKPGEVRIHSAPNLSERENVALRYRYFDPIKKAWKMLSASTVVFYPTRREICIFGWDPRYKRIDYHGITFPVF